MVNSIVFTLALLFTVLYFDYKFSKAVRIIVFNEREDNLGAWFDIVTKFVSVILWGVFYYLITK